MRLTEQTIAPETRPDGGRGAPFGADFDARSEARGYPAETVEFAVLRAAVALLGRLSHERALRLGAALGAAWGAAACRIGARQHRIAELNLRVAFPDLAAERRDAIRRAMWRSWGRMLADVVQLPRLDAAALRAIVRLEPREGAEEIFRRARDGGSIVLTAHFGSFELLHAGCAAHGFPITLVHRTLPNRRADRWLTALRERCGSRVLRRGAAAREILRELHGGGVVALPFDQRPPAGSAVYAPFFSLAPATHSGIARLAMASRSGVFPVFLVRDGGSPRHRAVFLPEVAMRRSGDRDADVVENTRRLNRVLEEVIRAHPDHWIWMYARWKRLPGGLVPPYRAEAPPLEAYWEAGRAAMGLLRPGADDAGEASAAASRGAGAGAASGAPDATLRSGGP